jgi:hypothetical protein
MRSNARCSRVFVSCHPPVLVALQTARIWTLWERIISPFRELKWSPSSITTRSIVSVLIEITPDAIYDYYVTRGRYSHSTFKYVTLNVFTSSRLVNGCTDWKRVLTVYNKQTMQTSRNIGCTMLQSFRVVTSVILMGYRICPSNCSYAQGFQF